MANVSSSPPSAQGSSHGEISIAITENLESASFECSDQCIHRAPEKLRRRNEEAYTPRVVSIGPFHHGNPKYEAMEKLKRSYFKTFLRRRNPKISKEECLQAAERWEEPARSCYSEIISLGRTEFIEMLILDGIFIVELFFSGCDGGMNDPIHRSPWKHADVWRDISLLENQLPLFVIQGVFRIAFGDMRGWKPFLQLVLEYSGRPYMVGEVLERTPSFCAMKHILDGVRMCLLPSVIAREQQQPDSEYIKLMPTATVLDKFGVRFEPREAGCFLDICYADGVLKIPCISIQDCSESLLSNLILWEHCQYRNDRYITNYMAFMSGLMNTVEDVDFLVRKRIVLNGFGKHGAVARLFGDACEDVVMWNPQFYYSRVCNELHAHCSARRNRWMVTLRRDYFTSPWAVISVIAAATLLLLTLVQTVCSVLSV